MVDFSTTYELPSIELTYNQDFEEFLVMDFYSDFYVGFYD